MATEKNGLTRVPAQELENRVMEKLAAFLKSDSDVFDGLNLADENPAVASRLVTAAKQLAARLTSLSSQDLRDLLASFLWRITLHENKIEIKIGRAELRKQLESGGKSVSASVPAKNSVLSSDWIGLTVEAKRKRCGGEVHLVVPPNSSVSREHRKLPLIKAVARAHGWYEKVVQGKAVDIRSLARDAGLADRYVRKVLRSAFLAPDIVESILAGHQPRDLNFEKLCQNLPSSWVEQRELLGFSPAITRRPPRSPIQ
ncbi:MAG: hypothetical protein WAL58_02240 [Terriglobales bacterium]